MRNKEDFVTYQQALALKRLGFKEPCLYNYDASKNFVPNSEIGNEGEGITTEDLLESHNFFEHNKRIDAPTLWQAQKWLRTKNLYVFEYRVNFKYLKFTYTISNSESTLALNPIDMYSSPEEALSAGITECIKLLEKED